MHDAHFLLPFSPRVMLDLSLVHPYHMNGSWATGSELTGMAKALYGLMFKVSWKGWNFGGTAMEDGKNG